MRLLYEQAESVLSILRLVVLFLLLAALLEVGPDTKDSHNWESCPAVQARVHTAPVHFSSDVGKDLRNKLVKDLAQGCRIRWSLKTEFQIPHFWY